MSALPRIYCLTLAGSTRHKAMKEKLEALGMPYEFFYGDRPSFDKVVWKDIKDCLWNDLDSDIILGIAGCKYGHINMLKKALLSTDEFFIFCLDDIGFKPDFKELIQDIIKNKYSQENNIFNLGYNVTWYWFAGYEIAKDAHTVKAPVLAGDQCYLMDRKGAELWLYALENTHMESDLGVNAFYKSINKNVITFIREYSLITMDERFHNHSSIAHGHDFT